MKEEHRKIGGSRSVGPICCLFFYEFLLLSCLFHSSFLSFFGHFIFASFVWVNPKKRNKMLNEKMLKQNTCKLFLNSRFIIELVFSNELIASRCNYWVNMSKNQEFHGEAEGEWLFSAELATWKFQSVKVETMNLKFFIP